MKDWEIEKVALAKDTYLDAQREHAKGNHQPINDFAEKYGDFLTELIADDIAADPALRSVNVFDIIAAKIARESSTPEG